MVNHQEAIEKLKRAAHLSRVNDGLDAKSQLPFVRAEIASHRALNQFVAADERHAYLSRIEARTIPSGPEKNNRATATSRVASICVA